MDESMSNTGLARALELWQENQLRVLVLASLAIQWFLFVFAPLRQHRIPGLLRLLIWLAYLGSDAVAIYALATLFNSHRCDSDTGSSRPGVELLWAPILLVHLGGQDSITAYNIEDNELWRRHVVTAVSQVAAAIYVFVKSWPKSMVTNEEMKAYWRILRTALVLFFCGITKCVFKPWDLKRVSFNSLVDSSSGSEGNGENEMNSLQEYARAATRYFESGHGRREELQEPSGAGSSNVARGHCRVGPGPTLSDPTSRDFDVRGSAPEPSNTCIAGKVWKPYNLCVDLAPPYSDRLSCLKHLVRNPADEAHRLVKSSLSATFHQLYTKESLKLHISPFPFFTSVRNFRTAAAASVYGALAVFNYGGGSTDLVRTDSTITNALLMSAVVMEYFLPNVIHLIKRLFNEHRTWPVTDTPGSSNLNKEAEAEPDIVPSPAKEEVAQGTNVEKAEPVKRVRRPNVRLASPEWGM